MRCRDEFSIWQCTANCAETERKVVVMLMLSKYDSFRLILCLKCAASVHSFIIHLQHSKGERGGTWEAEVLYLKCVLIKVGKSNY